MVRRNYEFRLMVHQLKRLEIFALDSKSDCCRLFYILNVEWMEYKSHMIYFLGQASTKHITCSFHITYAVIIVYDSKYKCRK